MWNAPTHPLPLSFLCLSFYSGWILTKRQVCLLRAKCVQWLTSIIQSMAIAVRTQIKGVQRSFLQRSVPWTSTYCVLITYFNDFNRHSHPGKDCRGTSGSDKSPNRLLIKEYLRWRQLTGLLHFAAFVISLQKVIQSIPPSANPNHDVVSENLKETSKVLDMIADIEPQ